MSDFVFLEKAGIAGLFRVTAKSAEEYWIPQRGWTLFDGELAEEERPLLRQSGDFDSDALIRGGDVPVWNTEEGKFVPANLVGSSPKAFVDWTRRPSGPFVPRMDTGQLINAVKKDTTIDPFQNGETLITDLTASPGAIYFNTGIEAKVKRMGAVFGFGPGAAGSSAALVAWTDTAMNGGPGGTFKLPQAHMHAVFGPTSWAFDVITATDIVHIAGGAYLSALVQDYRPYLVEVRCVGDRAWMLLPDGRVVGPADGLQDSRIASINGTAGCWEPYQVNAGHAPVKPYAWWFDDRPYAMGGSTLEASIAAKQVIDQSSLAAAVTPAGVVRKASGGTSENLTIPATPTAISGTDISARTGAGGKLWIDLEFPLVMGASDTYILNIMNAASGILAAQVVWTGTFNGWFKKTLVLEGYAANTTYALKIGHWAVSGGNPSNYMKFNDPTGESLLIRATGT